jgi:hypothetical protein
VHRDDVRFAQQPLEAHELNADRGGGAGVRIRIRRQDVRPERAQELGDTTPDAAKADEPDGATADEVRLEALPFLRAHAVRLRPEVPGQREE